MKNKYQRWKYKHHEKKYYNLKTKIIDEDKIDKILAKDLASGTRSKKKKEVWLAEVKNLKDLSYVDKGFDGRPSIKSILEEKYKDVNNTITLTYYHLPGWPAYQISLMWKPTR